MYRLDVTDRNGTLINSYENISLSARTEVFNRLIKRYPLERFYIFVNKTSDKD